LREEVHITGFTQNTLPGTAPVTAAGGLLAQSTNIGNHSRDSFAVVPELGVTLAYQVTSGVKLSVGYSALYLSEVVRPGDQIDPGVNPNLVPAFAGGAVLPPLPGGPRRPGFAF